MWLSNYIELCVVCLTDAQEWARAHMHTYSLQLWCLCIVYVMPNKATGEKEWLASTEAGELTFARDRLGIRNGCRHQGIIIANIIPPTNNNNVFDTNTNAHRHHIKSRKQKHQERRRTKKRHHNTRYLIKTKANRRNEINEGIRILI